MDTSIAKATESVSDDALVAELGAMRTGGDAAPAKKPAKDISEPDEDDTETEPDAPVETDDEAPEVEADADDETEVDVDSTDEDDDETDTEEESTEEVPASIRKAEQRMRARLNAERADLEKSKADHANDVKAVSEFNELRKRARYDRVGVLRSLGVTDDQFEDIAREFYANSESGLKDPKHKVAVERSAKERAQADEISELRKRLDTKDQAEATEKETAAATAQARAYVDGFTKKATAKIAPLAVHFLAKSPERTKEALGRLAYGIYQKTGREPAHAEVLTAYEKQRAAELRELDIDPKAIIAKVRGAVKAKTGTEAKTDEKKKAPDTSKKPDVVSDEDLLAEMKSLG